MKKPLILAALLLASIARAESLDPKEPVTIELKDAKLTDVITTMGAMANLPVVMDPGIEGKVTIRMEKVPFEKILAVLSRDNGLSIRIEDGKLVATRVGAAPAAAVPSLPDQFRDKPKFLMADYASAAAAPPPLVIKASAGGEEKCFIARVQKGGGGVLDVPLKAAPLVVADLGYDPVWKTRALAVETPGGTFRRNFNLGPTGSAVFTDLTRAGDSSRIVMLQLPAGAPPSEGSCSPLLFQPADGTTPVTVSLQAIAGRGSLVFAPRIQTKAGTVFKALGSDADTGSGQLRSYAISGYVSRDGKSVALSFQARAAWTDAGDGKQYCFTQAGEDQGFVPLTAGGTVASMIPPGVAAARSLELRVFGEE